VFHTLIYAFLKLTQLINSISLLNTNFNFTYCVKSNPALEIEVTETLCSVITGTLGLACKGKRNPGDQYADVFLFT